MTPADPVAASTDARIAARLRSLRAARRLTLDGLAARSGVSRAMLSRVERGESSPTAALLVRVCNGLGVTLPALLGAEAATPPAPISRRTAQPLWRDPASGYIRRAVSPAGTGSTVEIAEVEMPAGAAVLLDPLDRAGRDQHVWVLDGAIEVARGGEVVALGRGDCLRMAFDGPAGFRNPGPAPARYAVVTARRDGEGDRG